MQIYSTLPESPAQPPAASLQHGTLDNYCGNEADLDIVASWADGAPRYVDCRPFLPGHREGGVS